MEKMARKEENVLEMRLAEETFLWYQGVLLEEVRGYLTGRAH